MQSYDDTHKDRDPTPAPPESLQKLRAQHDALVRAAQEAVRDTTRLTRLFTILSEPAPLELMLDKVLSTLSELFAADIVLLVDPAGSGTFSPLAAVGLPEHVIHIPMSSADYGYVAVAMATRVPIIKEEVGLDTAVEPHFRELGTKTAVWVPVMGSHAARGVLILARCHQTPFARSDVDLLTAMAYRICLALDQAQRSRQLEQIVKAGRKIFLSLDRLAVFKDSVALFPSIVAADAAALILKDSSGKPDCVAQFGLSPQWDDKLSCLGEHLLADPHFANFEPYSTSDLQMAGDTILAEHLNSLPVRSLLVVPVHREGRLKGALCAMRFSQASFNHDTLQIAMLYAAQTSAAIENASLYQTVQEELAERTRAERRLHESEERLQLALMGADLGMWDWNVVTGEVSFNERWPGMLGYRLDEIEPTAHAREKLIHPDDLSRVRETLQSHLDGRTPYCETEHRFLAKTGKWIWVLDKGKVTHRDPTGKPLRFVGTCLDISETKQMQADRLQIEQQKHHAWRAESLSRMAGGIAHHFNNMFQVVIGNMELALEELPQDTNAWRWLSKAMKASGRASEISQLMLAYLGQKKGRAEELDLSEAARAVLPLLISSRPKTVRMKTCIQAKGPTVMADGVHIKQILTSLISNAIEAIGEREGEIVVEIRMMAEGEIGASRFFPLDWKPKPGSYASLSVSDTGCGMNLATQERIFEPFFTTKFTGRGLGMPVTLGLIRSYGGAISVASQLGRGTTFRVVFPAVQPQVASSRPSEWTTAPASPHTASVLLVDDDPMIRTTARAQLERLGYDVEEAGDGVEAVEIFQTKRDRIDLVLLDLCMPRMDGWESLAAIRVLRPDIPVVIASGYDEEQAMRGFQKEQPQAFLHKPYSITELRIALERVEATSARHESKE